MVVLYCTVTTVLTDIIWSVPKMCRSLGSSLKEKREVFMVYYDIGLSIVKHSMETICSN
jgi:hypothetical protein